MRMINKWMVTACVLLLPVQALAQTVTVGSDEGVGGDTLVLPVSYETGDTEISGVDFDIVFDDTQFSAASATCAFPVNTACPGAFTNCSVVGNTANIILAAGTACIEGVFGEITVTIDDNADFGVIPFNLNVIGLSSPAGGALPPETIEVVNGAVKVLGPEYSGTPSGLTNMIVTQGLTDPTGTLTIDNVGANDTTLAGDCMISVNPTVFSVNPTSFSVARDSAGNTTPDVMTVSCDSSQPLATHTGELSCDPDGDEGPFTYPLQCVIKEGPEPRFGSNPTAPGPIVMSSQFEDDPIDPETIAVNNEGGEIEGPEISVLEGTCTISGAPQIMLAATPFAIPAQSGQEVIQTLTCDGSAAGQYQATVSCPNNDPSNSNPQFNVTCNVGPQRPAGFDSDPDEGTIDMTPGDVKQGDTIDDQTLTIFNTVSPDGQNLEIECGFDGDPGEITTSFSDTTLIMAGGSFDIDFSCPNNVVADSTARYSCNWRGVDKPNDPTGTAPVSGTANWTYLCDVRGAEAKVVSDPASGSTITKQVPSGENGQFDIVFFVDPDEGVDGSLLSCTPDDDINFTVQSPTVFPAAIPSDGVLPVTVLGSDPGGVDELSTVLRCVYTDSNTPQGGTEWTYTLVMEIGSLATFRVTKYFDDDNPGTVRVELNCNHGLPLNQGFNISQTQSVNFVLSEFSDGEPECTITEVNLDGYTTSYWADGESNASYDDDGCYFTEVGRGDVNECQLTNSVDPVPVVITKDWIQEGNRGNQFDLEAWITVSSAGEIVGGYPCVDDADDRAYLGHWCKHLTFNGPSSGTQTVMVYPAWDGIDVFIDEDVSESYISSYNECEGMVTIYPDDGASCTITNSVFFEGIPTLNQWGMAIMILLMMGVGMVGFRRFI